MAVEIDFTRKAVAISWDKELVQGGMASIRATNTHTGDVSTRAPVQNDGLAVLTYPENFTGSSEVEVEGDEGGTDTGVIDLSEGGEQPEG